MSQLKDQLAQIDLALKNAKFNEARSLFFNLAGQKWPRKDLLDLCQLARRLNLPYLILRWLHPVVRPKMPLLNPATAAEKSMFAVGLTRIGAFAEAQTILEELPATQADKHFALGLLSIWQWNYGQAIRPLKKYLNFFPRGDYSYLIGLLNLSASYVISGELKKGEDCISILLEECKDGKYPLIRSNSLEVLAQSKLRQGLYTEVELHLNASIDILKSTGSDYELFVNKWKLILQLMRGEKPTNEILTLKDLAQKKKVFEASREIDFYEVLAQKNENKFLQIYHGTRFSGYKSRMKTLFSYDQRPPRDFICRFGPENSERIVSLHDLELTRSSKKLLSILLSDYYRPIQLGEAFKELYPQENFNPETSLPRLYQVFRRLKEETKSGLIPIQIQWKQKQIFWKPLLSFGLHIKSPMEKSVLTEMLNPIFSITDVMQQFSVSQSTAYKLVDEAISLRKITRRGAGIFKKTG